MQAILVNLSLIEAQSSVSSTTLLAYVDAIASRSVLVLPGSSMLMSPAIGAHNPGDVRDSVVALPVDSFKYCFLPRGCFLECVLITRLNPVTDFERIIRSKY
jgi:hypothetical protein